MPLTGPIADDVVELIAQRFRVLGEPMRIKLLDRLRAGEATVNELAEATGSTQQNASKHLAVLHQAGVVSRRKEGNSAFYAIADGGVLGLCEDVCGSIETHLGVLRAAIEGARI